MGIDAVEVVLVLLRWAFVLAALAGLVAGLYWVVRKAVAAGIRDARGPREAHKDR